MVLPSWHACQFGTFRKICGPDGEVLEGRWFDRTQEYAARRRGEKPDRLKYSTPESLTLEPLPCWEHLEPERRRERIAALVKEIEDPGSRRGGRKTKKPLLKSFSVRASEGSAG